MKTVRVGDVAEQLRGVTFSKADAISSPREGYVAVLTAGNLQDGQLNTSDLTYVPAGKVSGKQQVRQNDVVICASSGSLSVVGKAAQSDGSFAGGFGAFLKVLRPGPEVDPRYFAHYFQTQAYRRTVSSLAAGANINNLKNEHLNDLLLPLPPLPEQRRIAAILDHADALRAKRRQILSHIDAVTDSIFDGMFARESHPLVALGDIASVKGGKRLPKGALYADGPTRHPYIRVSDLRDGVIQTSNLCFLTTEVQRQIARYTVDEGDVIISIAGSIGLTAAVPPALAGANLTENAAKIVPMESQAYSGAWLARVLQTRSLQDQIASKVGRVTIGKLALFRIEQLELPLPPLALQEQFVDQAAKIDALRTDMQRTVTAEDELFASLQSRAFRGEL